MTKLELRITARQRAYIDMLAKERGIQNYNEQRVEGLSMKEASRLIEWLKAKPKKQQQGVERGSYKYGDHYYVVTKARDSQRLYARRIVVTSYGKVRTQYAPSVYRALTDDMKLTEAEAVSFGVQFGVCCMCAKLLSNPESVKAGIGPVCRKRFFGH